MLAYRMLHFGRTQEVTSEIIGVNNFNKDNKLNIDHNN